MTQLFLSLSSLPGRADRDGGHPPARRHRRRPRPGRPEAGCPAPGGPGRGLQHAPLRQPAGHHRAGWYCFHARLSAPRGKATNVSCRPAAVQVASRSLVCSAPQDVSERDSTVESSMEDVRTAILGLLEILQVCTRSDGCI